MADIYSEQRVREIVREEVADIRVTLAEHGVELHRQGILIENIQDTLKTILELLSTNLHVVSLVDDHQIRIKLLEASQKLLANTVRDHSQQLKTV